MTNVDEDRKIRPVLNDDEFNLMLAQARGNAFSFLALRNPAILCTIMITGKRRTEVASLMRRDVYIDKPNLAMNFILLKKHKVNPPQIVRYIPLKDPLSKPILEYKNYVDEHYPDSPEFWIGTRYVFGSPVIYPYKGISGRQVYNVVRDAGDSAGVKVWPHLFRETAGAEEIRRDPSQYGVQKVMNRIDVTERTAWSYMQRHILTVIERDYDRKKETD